MVRASCCEPDRYLRFETTYYAGGFLPEELMGIL